MEGGRYVHQGEREVRCTVHVHVYQNLPNVHTCMWEYLSDRKKGIKREEEGGMEGGSVGGLHVHQKGREG